MHKNDGKEVGQEVTMIAKNAFSFVHIIAERLSSRHSLDLCNFSACAGGQTIPFRPNWSSPSCQQTR